jgi:short-subunit dehydrogenase
MTKTIAIFGIGKGLGLSVAHKFAKEGFNVAIVARQQSNLDGYLNQFKDSKTKIKGYLADLSVTQQLNTAIDNILKDFGFVDVVFCSAADSSWQAAAQLTTENAMAHIQLYYFSAITLVQRFLPSMLESKEVSRCKKCKLTTSQTLVDLQ